MPGPPVLNGPFTMPMMNSFVPRAIQPWIYVVFAFVFQLSSGAYAGAIAQAMGDTTMMRADFMMIVLCGLVGVNMPFPFLFRFKFRFTNRALLMNAALVIATCNFLSTLTESIPVLCFLSYVAGFFKLCGTFECMSNIQLWMTPKRDFAIFFPLLYCIVVGNMSLSPWLTVHLTYIFQDYHTMQYVMSALLLTVALLVFLLTHPFHFMKPLPLVSLDWLGCWLWSALMIEVLFLFNYGEYYNWWDGRMWRTVLAFIPITAYICIQRMRHIRHPYIHPKAWLYKGLIPLFILFTLMKLVDATAKVLQSVFTGSILHFGTLSLSVLYFWEWLGTIVGCLFVLVWVKVFHQPFTRLLILGTVTLFGYVVMLYFLVSPGVNIEAFYPSSFCRTFSIAVFFTALTILLEEMMPFQHFFMGLTIVGFIRTGGAETVCSGIYSYALRHYTADNLVRGLPYDSMQATLISLKQLFGVTCIIAAVVMLIFLLWNIQPIRSTLKRMPYWNVVGRMTKKMMHHRLKRMAQAAKK